jgi:hypothetical protein
MKAYQINIAPRTGVGMGFVTVGEREPRSCRVLKVFDPSIIRHAPKNTIEILRTLRKPGRLAFQKHQTLGSNTHNHNIVCERSLARKLVSTRGNKPTNQN